MDDIFFEINLHRTECVKFIAEKNAQIEELKIQWLEKYCPIKVGDRLASQHPSFYLSVDKIKCVFTNYGVVPQRILWEASGEIKNEEGVTVKLDGLTTFTVGELWFKDKGFHESNRNR